MAERIKLLKGDKHYSVVNNTLIRDTGYLSINTRSDLKMNWIEDPPPPRKYATPAKQNFFGKKNLTCIFQTNILSV